MFKFLLRVISTLKQTPILKRRKKTRRRSSKMLTSFSCMVEPRFTSPVFSIFLVFFSVYTCILLLKLKREIICYYIYSNARPPEKDSCLIRTLWFRMAQCFICCKKNLIAAAKGGQAPSPHLLTAVAQPFLTRQEADVLICLAKSEGAPRVQGRKRKLPQKGGRNIPKALTWWIVYESCKFDKCLLEVENEAWNLLVCLKWRLRFPRNLIG